MFKKILSIGKKSLPFVLIIILTPMAFFYIYRAWGLKFNIPYFYREDALWNLAGIKGFIEGGKFIENKNIGAPFGTNYYDYPGSDFLYMVSIFILSLFIKNSVIILNFYYFLTFLISAIVAYFVLKYFKISTALAIFFSLIFSFLPYHIVQGTKHINLSTYYPIFLVILILYWIFMDQIYFDLDFSQLNLKKLLNNKFFLSIIFVIFLANDGVYYSFFTVTFILLSSILSAFEHKKIDILFKGIVLTIAIFLTVSINVSPNIIHELRYGKNPAVAARTYNEAEYYGLKIIELFIPVRNFKSDLIKKFKERYLNLTFTKSEGSAYLGIIGCLGFIVLMLNIFTKKSFDKRLDYLSYLTLWALFLSVTTGIGTIIGYLISSQIRVYARISIFINIFSVLAIAFISDYLIKKHKLNKLILNILLVLIAIFAILEQSKPIELNATDKNIFNSDQVFVSNIEKAVDSNAMIFELPYKSFPESIPINKLTDYDLFRGYIHSNRLRWSYGIIKGTAADDWIRNISEQPLNLMVESVTKSGYEGIYIDRDGYSDRAIDIENKLTKILDEKPIESPQNDLIFFSLKNFRANLIKQLGENNFLKQQKKILTLSNH